MAEEIKDCGESSWWQGDCKPNRTHTLTAILAESAMNKEKKGERSAYLNISFPYWWFVTVMNFISYDC